MASNSITLDCGKVSEAWTLSVEWSETDVDISSNTSMITAKASLGSSTASFDALYDSYACHLYLYWHDDNNNTDKLIATSSAFTTCGMGYGTRTVKGNIKVGHKSDGSLKGYVKAYFDAPTTSGGWSPSSSSVWTSWITCTTIARASSISSVVSPTEYLGQPVTVTIDKKSSGFDHEVQYRFEGSPWVVAEKNVDTSCTFIPPDDLSAYIPNSVKGMLEVSVATFSNGNQIGDWIYYSIPLWVPESFVPGISNLYASRIDNGVPSDWGIFVKGVSQVKITASGASGCYGSSIIGYSISGPGLYIDSSSGESGILSTDGTLTYTCTVTDSRGRTASKSVSITVVDYSYPSISMQVERCNSYGVKDTSGTYLKVLINYSIAPVAKKNTVLTRSCSCNGASNTSFVSGVEFILAANCNIADHYIAYASVKDALGNTASISSEVNTAYRIVNINEQKTGMAIGKFSEKEALEVNMDTYLYGNSRIKGNHYVENNFSVAGRMEPWNVFLGEGKSDAYIRLCRITIKGTYVNYPLEITYQQRGSATSTTLCILFNSESHLDPGVQYFKYRGECRSAYIVKAKTSTWDVYITKSQVWDQVGFLNWSFISEDLSIQKIGENASSIPSGYIKAVSFYASELANIFFPVGSIYMTASNNNPGNFLGGTWVRYAEGRTVFGVGQSTDINNETFTVSENEEWGEKRKTFRAHIGATHSDPNRIGYAARSSRGGSYSYSIAGSGSVLKDIDESKIMHTTAVTDQHGDESAYIIPPYSAVYFWKRTA